MSHLLTQHQETATSLSSFWREEIDAAQFVQWSVFEGHLSHLDASEKTSVRLAFDLAKDACITAGKHSDTFTQDICRATALATLQADSTTLVTVLLRRAVHMEQISLNEVAQMFSQDAALCVERFCMVFDGESSNNRAAFLRAIIDASQQGIHVLVLGAIDRYCRLCFGAEKKRSASQISLAKEAIDIFVPLSGQLGMFDLCDALLCAALRVIDQDLLDTVLNIQQSYDDEVHARISPALRNYLSVQSSSVDISIEPEHRLHQIHHALQIDEKPTHTVCLICNSTEECYQCLHVLHEAYHPIADTFCDWIAAPRSNGYRALHTTVLLPQNEQLQCRIRTKDMDVYAHNGIATRCFASDQMGIEEYIPWIQSARQLSEYTPQSSKDFFRGLQRDILSDHVCVRYDNGQKTYVPRGATALDAALWSYGDRAYWSSALYIDGKEAHYSMPLQHDVTLMMQSGVERSVTRRWLQSVSTVLSKAMIHRVLSSPTRAQKIEQGRQLLQEDMHLHRKGFLEEYDSASFLPVVEELGYASLDDMLVSIADGARDPDEAYRALFEPHTDEFAVQRCQYICTLPAADADTCNAVLKICKKYQEHIVAVHMRNKITNPSVKTVIIKARLSHPVQQLLLQELQESGVQDASVLQNRIRWKFAAIVSTMFLIWGLDPVVAKVLLSRGISAVDLTLVRFGILPFLSAAYLVGTSQHRHLKFNLRLPIDTMYLLSAVSLFATAFLSYLALPFISATSYIGIMIIAAIAGLSPAIAKQSMRNNVPFLFCAVVLIGTCALLFASQGLPILGMSMLTSIGAGIGFTVYSLASAHYQAKVLIQRRYPLFIFYLSLCTFTCSLTLIPFSSLSTLSGSLIVQSVAFATVFTILPYVLFFNLLKRDGVELTSRFMLFSMFIVIAGEALILGTWSWLALVIALETVVWAALFPGQQKVPERNAV